MGNHAFGTEDRQIKEKKKQLNMQKDKSPLISQRDVQGR